MAASLPYRLFTAPGLVFHELSHYVACLLVGRSVKEVKLISRSGGHVISSGGGLSYAFTALAPFFLGNIFAFLFLRGSLELFTDPFGWNLIFGAILFWFAASLAYMSFPSNTDISNSKIVLGNSMARASKKGGIALFYWLILLPVYAIVLVLRPIIVFFNSSRAFRLIWFFILAFLALA